MSSEERDPLHVRVHPQCGACGIAFEVGDGITSVVKSDDGFRMLDAPPFLACAGRYADSNPSPTKMFCQFQPCGPCITSDESATFHHDCVNLFRMRYTNKTKSLQKLWFIATSRTPFHHFPLPPLRFDNVNAALRTIASKAYALPASIHLPNELWSMIWGYSSSAQLWQYSCVIGLADELEPPADVSSCYSLSAIESWSREEEPSLTSELGFMRLTFDQDGLSKIERLRETPKEHDYRDTPKVYVIEPVAALSCVTIEFKFNRARLNIPNATTIRIWDTPAPPDLKRCLFLAYSGPECSRFVTVPTRNCTGLTFFFWLGNTKAIHAHTERSPFAQETFNKLPSELRKDLIWIYVPFTSNNPIVGFGVRLIRGRYKLLHHLPRFLFRMELSGDLEIGPCHGTNTEDLTRRTSNWPTIVHNWPECNGSISNVGVYPSLNGDIWMSQCSPTRERPFIVPTCHSSAPLEQVARTKTYYDIQTHYCKGILFEYNDNTQMTVGQCRMGLDPFETCHTPSHLCYSTQQDGQPNRIEVDVVTVRFITRQEYDEEQESTWERYSMSGNLVFWFTVANVKLEVQHT